MKTVPFSDILASVCQLVGLDRTTLNDKAFGAIRDFTGRRLTVIWDREEWPDVQRYMYTWPGMPVQSIQAATNILATETDEFLDTEDSESILTQNQLNTNTTRINFDTNFKRIYLQDFLHDRYKLGTVGESYVKFLNPFYGSVDDGPLTSVSENQYNFTYTTAVDDLGQYITAIDIETDFTNTNYFTYAGPNSPLATKVLFMDNQQLLIQIPQGSLQGLAIYTNDPRQTTRAIPLPFIAEDFADQTPQTFGDDVNYLRTFNTSKQFVQYRLTPPRMFGVKYDPIVTYTAGSQVYFDIGQNTGNYAISDKTKASNGNFFFANTNVSAGVTPSSQTSEIWQILEIPARFRDYLANSVSADFLKSEGRIEEAVTLEQLAETAIQQQIDVLIRQQAQNQRLNMAYTY
ncbi:hypothetical protein UFOVP811_9 [uncultured Caudovirales phage]|uniref:Uncharacterized protein n=1 Tax=uncultured Caudovirales phage TaxID=2100421 RepID=A0A6J5P6M7_9CAUD|nr:hypothetical protein UFOVP811_9 [uncultured Caudovirales phage]